LPAISGLPLSRPALPRRKKPITIATIIIALIIDVTITIAATTESLTRPCCRALSRQFGLGASLAVR